MDGYEKALDLDARLRNNERRAQPYIIVRCSHIGFVMVLDHEREKPNSARRIQCMRLH